MRTKWQGLMFVAAIGCMAAGAGTVAGAPAPGHDEAPSAAVKPQSPEYRPSSPEDEALKRLVGQRKSNKGITLSSSPLTRPHKVLGTVSVEASALQGGADAKPGPNLYMNELLRSKAVEVYGEDNVDGIMNITYEPAAKGKMRAHGTAVHFEKQ
jgi:hypothetical protein